VTADDAGKRRGLVRLLLSLLLLAATLHFSRAGELVGRVVELDAGFALAAALACLLQFPLLSARWWLIARWLGVPLAYRQALGEYTLSTLLNQLLPLGVLGDALRLARHAEHVRRERPTDPAPGRVALALVLDRASGQLALWLWVLAVAPEWWRSLSSARRAPGLVGGFSAVVVSCLIFYWFVRPRWQAARALMEDAARVLLAPRRLLLHLTLSLSLVLLHAVAFALVARALAFELGLARALYLVPPLLVATTVPGFFAGFGVREAAAAGLYALSGLSSAEGALVSLTWGCLGLLASAPGVFFWWRARSPR
jgi:glycosyltransferase 2 family protein